MKKVKKNKKGFLIFILTNKLLFLVLSIILLSLIILFTSKKQNKSSDNSSARSTSIKTSQNFKKTEINQITGQEQSFHLPSSVNPEITNILKKTYSIINENKKPNIDGDIKITASGNGTWTDSSGYIITSDNVQSIEWVYRDDIKKYQNDIHQYKLKIIPYIENAFSDEGFKKQTLLSGDYIKQTDIYFGEYLYVYEKDNIQCSFIISDESSSHTHIRLSCTEKYQEAYQYQIKILKDLNIKRLSILSSTISGKYAIFQLNHTYVLAIMDTNNNWHNLYEGVEPPPCNILIKNKVPSSLISTCYPSDNSSPISNPVN